MPPLLQLRDTGADARRRAASRRRGTVDFRRRPHRRRRAQRIGQIDAVSHRRGPDDGGPGTRFVQPSARLAYLPQEPDMSGFATTLDYVLRGLGEFDDPYAARAMMAELGVDPAADPSRLSGGEARRAALVRVLEPRARHPAARRADQPSRSGRDRMAGGAPRRQPLGARAHQPRQAAARRSHARDGLARSRRARAGSIRVSAPSRPGATRSSRRRSSSATSSTARSSTKSIGCATASPRGASATCGASASLPICAASGAKRAASVGRRDAWSPQDAKASGALVIEAERISKSLRRARRSCATSRCASCAATGSASSAPTARARRR